MKKIKYIPLVLGVITALSCTKSQYDEFDATSGGTASFTNYIAVGNSLTQGYQDGGLHNEYQQQDNSYPAIIAKQMGTTFLQPMVSGAGSGHKFLQALGAPGESPTITDVLPDPNFDWGNPSIAQVPTGWNTWNKTNSYNNLGVAGVKLRDCVGGGTGSLFNTLFNPFGAYLNFGVYPTPTSYLDMLKTKNATFFTNWLGNNDVLSWSTGGGVDGNPSTAMTPVTEFRNKYDSILDAFSVMGAKGVCATLPDVTAIPFFTTVPYNPIPMDQATADAVNSGYAAYNSGLDGLVAAGMITATEAAQRKINFTASATNSIVIMDKSLTDLTSINPALINMRQATAADFILLTSSSEIGIDLNPDPLVTVPYGVAVPFADSLVLTAAEVIEVQNHTNSLNAQINASAAAHGVAVVDMYNYMFELQAGITFDGVDYTASYIEGGAFSLDGVHPNTRGYAMIANKFMEKINSYYGSNLRPVPVQNYRGIIFP